MYRLYDLDVCLGECEADSIEEATRILCERFSITSDGGWFVEQVASSC